MDLTRKVSFAMILLLVASALVQSAQITKRAPGEEILDHEVSISLPDHEGSIQSALLTVLSHARAPGGIATVSGCNEEAKYGFPENRTSLRDALNTIVSTSPTNLWQNKGGVVNLIPVTGVPALLNVRIAEFNVENARTVLGALEKVLQLPEVRERIAQLHLQELDREPGLSDLKRPGSLAPDPPGFNVHCKNTTFRGVLNAIASAHGFAVWSYTEKHCDGGVDNFRIDFILR